MGINMGKVGIWSMELRFGDPVQGTETAAELDELGYGALWIPGGIDDAVLGDVDRLLSATKNIVIATGIINMWKQSPEDVAAWWKGQSADRQRRVMLGLGVSHAPIIGDAWDKPVARARDYVERAAAAGLPAESMCLAALGPKMVELSRDRTAGAHPYLVSPAHTASARAILGEGKLLMPEQGVVLETDPTRARELAHQALAHYRNLPNYRNNWKRLGFSEDEIGNLSDRLTDSLFAWGTPEQVAQRVKEHHDAGADHVCLQVISDGDFGALRKHYRTLAEVLLPR